MDRRTGLAPADGGLSAEDLEGTTWSFSRDGDDDIIAPFLVLRPGGTIGGYFNDNERRWDVEHGRLCFFDKFGRASTRFQPVRGADGIERFIGGFADARGTTHVLRPTPYPAQPNCAPVPGDRVAEIACLSTAPRRRNLMIVRAGEGSLHGAWRRDIPGEDRNWDLMVSWYETSDPTFDDPPTYLARQPQYTIKWRAFYDLTHADSPVWDYDFVCIADDDLVFTWRDINRMFEICRRNQLHLAQASLSSDSHINHPHTAQQPQFALRFTDFVEGMAPVFSVSALRTCRKCFKDTVYGFGIDHLWTSLVGSVRTQIAIIDEIAMVHTRPMASRYDKQAAIAEDTALLALYRVRQQYRIFGAILRDCDI